MSDYYFYRIKIRFMQLPTRFMMWLVYHLPKSVIYYSTIRLVAAVTTGKYSNTIVPELSAMDAIQRYQQDNDIK